MFTGIIQTIGKIQNITRLTDHPSSGIRLQIDAPKLDLNDVHLGDSIAIQGACMTVTQKEKQSFIVEVSQESLQRTVGLDQLSEVNLEKALRAQDFLGGHIVSGHVDGIAHVSHFSPVGESHELRIRIPRAFSAYAAYKGSITINGVSLTINQVQDLAEECEISINLIAHTMMATTLKNLKVNDAVNIEIDILARYIERMLHVQQNSHSSFLKD